MTNFRTLIFLCIPLTFLVSGILLAISLSFSAIPELIIILSFLPWTVNILMAFFIFSDAKKNNLSPAWLLSGLIFGWVGAIIYLIFSSIKVDLKQQNTPVSKVNIPLEFYEQNPRPEKIVYENRGDVSRNRMEEVGPNGQKILYYENGKPVYESNKKKFM